METSKTDLFSRQIGAIGTETMNKLQNLNVLLIGSSAIGIECTKCLALLGIHSLHIFDTQHMSKKSVKDLYYYKSPEKSQKWITFGENSANFARELNRNLDIYNLKQLNYKYILSNNIDCIIVTKLFKQNSSMETLKLEEFCLSNNIKFILGIAGGLEGYIFSNFGKHTITDKDGESCESGYIEGYEIKEDEISIDIEKLDKNLISNRIELLSNDKSIESIVISSTKTLIIIPRTKEMEEFLDAESSIRCIEKKETLQKQYKSIQYVKDDLNYKYISIDTSFRCENSDKSYKNFINTLLYRDTFETIESKTLYQQLFGELNDKLFILSSIIGGIIAHEVIKITGKYTPIEQDIYIDFRKLKGKELYRSSIHKNSGLLDKQLIQELNKQQIFMVGCGALGCEISKNLGMIDCCTRHKSQLTITDMDIIESSNLNRQFLFREDSIGKYKSSIIEERLKDYTPKMKVQSKTLEVGKNTEHIFNSTFWKNKSIIINALDNVQARQYVDSKCVEFDKPLFESGTLGCKCNSQTIIPYKTATYSEIIDIEDSNIPMCTIKSFPNKIEHCIEWGLETFQNIITQPLNDIRVFIDNKQKFKEEIDKIQNAYIIKKRLEILEQYLSVVLCPCYNNVMDLIKYIYDSYFNNPIKDILYTFPDNLIGSDGKPYWSGKKLKPVSIDFKEISIEFSKNLYILFQTIFTLEDWQDTLYNEYINSLTDTKYVCNRLKINEDKDEIYLEADASKIIDRIFNDTDHKYKAEVVNKLVFNIEYDKDNDILLDIMYSISNMRATLYTIPCSSRIDIKLISGKIIPALSTTTTIIAGFVVLELLKYLSNIKPSDCNINIGTNQYIMFDSYKPKLTYNNMYSEVYGMQIETIPNSFSAWSKLKISSGKEGCPDIVDLVNILRDNYSIEPELLMVGKKIIYNKHAIVNKTIYELFSELKIAMCENITIYISSVSKEGIPILTPRVILSN